jgi:hypothetical protein
MQLLLCPQQTIHPNAQYRFPAMAALCNWLFWNTFLLHRFNMALLYACKMRLSSVFFAIFADFQVGFIAQTGNFIIA